MSALPLFSANSMPNTAGRVGRPCGEIRQALTAAAQAAPGPVTWRELAVMACVGFAAAKATARNMEAAGELEAVGTRKVPGICRPVTLYAPGRKDLASKQGADLACVLSRWVRS
jgi:hypothetical protein